MKRTPLKRKKQLKQKTRLRKHSNRPIAKLKKLAWDTFSRYIRLRDCLATTKSPNKGKCVTCGKIFPFKRLQAGHYLPGRHNSVLFEEKQVHAQCYRCNILLKSNWVVYTEVMRNKYGDEYIEYLKLCDKQNKQFTAFELEMLITQFSMKIEGMGK